ncbi:sensor histidine kinase [Pseudomonas viridiflava]|uniref:sensor histidine kinase n=1 Tax=Pseudomonas viridiflava TaxID=33069 RepID=UPI0018E606A4|nr:sensor histidine kinase [Pseudomonas viridiflava]
MKIYNFKPRARLIRTIGDKLVSGPIAAIVELVKNAHDADSSFSTIKFLSDSLKKSKSIEILDQGHGMRFETLIGSWMEPATEHKVKKTHSAGGRKLLGSKGIGRFAASRLGDSMTLTTSSLDVEKRTVEITTVKINWKEFDGEKYLDQVPIQIRRSLKPANYPTGTRIRIRNLRDEWVSNEILDLYRELRRLVSPLEKETSDTSLPLSNAFSIYIDLTKALPSSIPTSLIDTAAKTPKKIEPAPILDSADYVVTGEFDNNGIFTGEMTFNALGKPFTETISGKFDLKDDSGLAPCGNVRIRLLIFDREAASIDALIDRAKLTGYGKRAARHILDEMTGVGIYRDGFRIRPYGDKDQDWLELSRRRIDNPSMRIGPNQMAGFISIADEKSSDLIERSSREGLEANGSYKRLQKLITDLLGSTIEPMRRTVREGTGKGKRKTRHEHFIEAAEFTWKEKILSEIPASKRSEARMVIESAQDDLKKKLTEQIAHERVLEARATLGNIIAEVLHEFRTPLKSIGGLLRHLKFDWTALTEPQSTNTDLKEKYKDRISDNTDQSKRMEKLLSQLDPLATKKSGPPSKQDVYQPIKSSVEILSILASEEGVSIQLEGKPGAKYLGYGDEIQTALINMINNSIYWLSKHKTKTPTVKIVLSGDDSDIIITVADNGPGIGEKYHNSIFEAGFSTKTSEGQGLGLAIARETLARIGGNLELVTSEIGCTFKITIKGMANNA